MRLVTAKVWSPRRKWLGNLIPAAFWLPPAAVAVFEFIKSGQFVVSALWLLIASTVLGWLAVNQFGRVENERRRRQLQRILTAEERDFSGESIFAGFASPRYSSMLDPHQDVGLFCLRPDSIVFLSEVRTIEILKSDVVQIRRRLNVHSFVGLGGWVSVEAMVGGRPIRLLVEPRERPTLIGNRRLSGKLLRKLRAWLKTDGGAPAPVSSSG